MRIGVVGRVVSVGGGSAAFAFLLLLLLGPAAWRTQALPGVTVGRAVAHRTFVGEIKVPILGIGRSGRAQLTVQPRPGFLRIGGRPEQYASHRQRALVRHPTHRKNRKVVVDVDEVVVVGTAVFRFGDQHAPAAATASVTVAVVFGTVAAATVSIGCLRNRHVEALVVVVGGSVEEERRAFIKRTRAGTYRRGGFVMPCRKRRRTFWRALYCSGVPRKSDGGFF